MEDKWEEVLFNKCLGNILIDFDGTHSSVQNVKPGPPAVFNLKFRLPAL